MSLYDNQTAAVPSIFLTIQIILQPFMLELWRAATYKTSHPNLQISPNLRTESLALCNFLLNRHLQIIQRPPWSGISPPVRKVCRCQVQRRNDQNRANRKPYIQTRTRDIVEAHPPPTIPIPNNLLEYETYQAPGEIREWCCGRKLAHATEEDRRAEEADLRAGPSARYDVQDDGHDGASEPEVLEIAVEGAAGEDALWTDEAENN